MRAQIIYSNISVDENNNLVYSKLYRIGTRYTKEVPDNYEIIGIKTDSELMEELEAKTLAQETARLEAKAKKDRVDAMLAGADYNGVTVSLTKDDGDGLVQVKNGFELGLTSTVIHFENGAKLPMTVEEFPAFASWFVNKRNLFFVGE